MLYKQCLMWAIKGVAKTSKIALTAPSCRDSKWRRGSASCAGADAEGDRGAALPGDARDHAWPAGGQAAHRAAGHAVCAHLRSFRRAHRQGSGEMGGGDQDRGHQGRVRDRGWHFMLGLCLETPLIPAEAGIQEPGSPLPRGRADLTVGVLLRRRVPQEIGDVECTAFTSVRRSCKSATRS